MWNLNYGTNKPIYKTETDSQTGRTDLVSKGKWGDRGMDREFAVGRCKLLHLEWINNKVLLYSTGNYIQSPGINHNRKEHEKECMCVMYRHESWTIKKAEHRRIDAFNCGAREDS